MIPRFILKELDSWIDTKSYGELRIIFQEGKVQRWTKTTSILPPKESKSSEPLKSSGTPTVSKDTKPEDIK